MLKLNLIHLIALLIINNLKFFYCESNDDRKNELLKEDFLVDYTVNDKQDYIEVFHTNENVRIMEENNSKNHRKLKWYTIGYPIITESDSRLKSKKSFFHFTSKGFYASIKMLTDRQKRLIIQKIGRIHNISVEMSQIKELTLSKFDCQIELYGENDDESSIVKGSVKSFKASSFRIEFDSIYNSSEYNWLKRDVSDRLEDIELVCDIISDKHGFNKQNFILKVELQNQTV